MFFYIFREEVYWIKFVIFFVMIRCMFIMLKFVYFGVECFYFDVWLWEDFVDEVSKVIEKFRYLNIYNIYLGDGRWISRG